MVVRICCSWVRGSIATVSWNVLDRPCRPILAPVLIGLSRRVALRQSMARGA